MKLKQDLATPAPSEEASAPSQKIKIKSAKQKAELIHEEKLNPDDIIQALNPDSYAWICMGEGGGAPLTHFLRRPPSGPARPRGSPSPEGGIQRGVGGPHAPHPQHRPGRGERTSRLGSSSWSGRSKENPPRVPGPGPQDSLLATGPRRRGPQRRGRGPRRGRSCKQPPASGPRLEEPRFPGPVAGHPSPQPAPGPPRPGPGGTGGGSGPPWEGSGSLRSGPRSREGGSQDLPVITFYAILDPLVNVPTKHYGSSVHSGGLLPPGSSAPGHRRKVPPSGQTAPGPSALPTGRTSCPKVNQHQIKTRLKI
ncbi:uncharacterized protein LOC143686554 [Tamandua tetradactyla]|uniref:uncharacterized protein LOC143686554 n=1 Tax=Tamandua tetradactyla TaxID=48850 RepID=UPI0040545942